MSENEQNSQLKPQEIIEMLFRRRIFFIIPLVIVFLFSIIAGLFLPKTFETSSLIQVRNREIIDPLVRGIAVSPDEIRVEINTLSKQILSWPKLEQLITQLSLVDVNIAPEELEAFIIKLKNRINIRLRDREMVEIVYQDQNPAKAQQVVNTLTQNFIDENARLKKMEARNAIAFIGDQLTIYRNKLERSQKDFSTSKIDSDLRLALNRRTLLNDRMNNLQKIIPSSITTERNPVIAQLQTNLARLETELARLLLDAREGNPRVVELQEEIANFKKRIELEMDKKDTVKESVSTFNPLYLQSEQDMKIVEMEISYLEKSRGELVNLESTVEKKITEDDLANLERNKRVDEDIYQMLLRQLESAYVSERLQDSEKSGRFTVIEYARLPLVPVKPNMKKILSMGLFGGMALGFGLVFMIENMSKSFHTIEQVKGALNLPALGSISKILLENEVKKTPVAEVREKIENHIEKNSMLSKMKFISPHIARKILDSGISSQVVVYHEPKSIVAEEYRILRTHLYQGAEVNPDMKTILVTSTLKGEGKSTTSANLAVAVASTGKNTLLIDCDLRKGVVKDLFAVGESKGLSDIIVNGTMLDSTLFKTSVSNLTVLPSGTKRDNPSEILSSSRMGKLLEILKGRFEVLILDAPPVMHLPDTSILSKYADNIVFVIQAGRTRQKDVLHAQSALKQVNAKVAGFVLTNVRYYMPKYVYDYYYDN